jgi:hypothetical protein
MATTAMEQALSKALRAGTAKPENAAIESLARRLAKAIDKVTGTEDETTLLPKLAAEYRQALAAMCLTPAALLAAKRTPGPVPAEVPLSPLDELRRRREQRTGT